MLVVDNDKCNADGLCVALCPVGAIKMNEAGDKAEINGDECIECYACKDSCPQEAIYESEP